MLSRLTFDSHRGEHTPPHTTLISSNQDWNKPELGFMDFPGSSAIKNPPANAGDTGSIPGSGRSAGEGNGNPLKYSCLGNPMDRGGWRGYTVHGVSKSLT